MVKPSHLRHMLNLVAEGQLSHFRLVAHASSDDNFAKIAEHPAGLDVRFCKSMCRYGKGCYIATTYDTGESQYNLTGIKGKTLPLFATPQAVAQQR